MARRGVGFYAERAMPDLDNLANGIDSDVDLHLLSIAGFPSDPDRQRVWFDQARNTRIGEILKRHRPAMLPDDQALHKRVIAAAASGSRFELGSSVEYGLRTRAYRATAYLLVRVLASRPSGSLNQAIAALITGDGARASVAGASEATIRRWWDEFAPAAHLGAVLLFHLDSVRADPAGMGLRTSYSPIGAGSGLAWAEALRVAGEQYKAPHSLKTLLDPERTWKMPPSLQLPYVRLDLPDPERVTFTP
jgi:hypothetical protein